MSDERKAPTDMQAFCKELEEFAERRAKERGLLMAAIHVIVGSPTHPGAREHHGKEWKN